MLTVRRTDNSIVGRWWWTIDCWSLLAIVVLIALGGVLTLAASPAVADRLGLGSFHFVKRQLAFAIVACALLGFVSFLSPTGVRRLGNLGFAVALIGACRHDIHRCRGERRTPLAGYRRANPATV